MYDFFVTFVLFYLCLLVFLYFSQRSLIYFPYRVRVEAPAGVEVAAVRTEDGLDLQGWYFAPQEGRPVLVYFHGNAGSIANRLFKFPEYVREGYGVLLAEYRGYGGNPGAPHEDGLYRDGQAYIDWPSVTKGIEPGQIVLYGESLGTGVAVELAAKMNAAGKKVKAVVLEAPFTSLLDMARRNYFFIPVDYLLLDRYLSADKIGSVGVPLLIVNGRADEVIPFVHGHRLFEAAKSPKRYVQIKAGRHEDLHLLGLSSQVIDFLSGAAKKDGDNEKTVVYGE